MVFLALQAGASSGIFCVFERNVWLFFFFPSVSMLLVMYVMSYCLGSEIQSLFFPFRRSVVSVQFKLVPH